MKPSNFDLTCFHCLKFNLSACPPCCNPGHKAHAEPDSPACSYFHRVVDVRLVSHEQPLNLGRRKSDRLEDSHA